ncbi:AAA family ATPase [Actinoplanes hulinensis]|uniref:AAA family ATPase n=1 Tax=Actinoplanes hulinensis TaxID=1144547 RepID=A0ABS7BCE1_9ACTN|nr:AAA family ATPase [Actinoplanes hulinensis]MBW6438567.1 AAA family ATPase [Actinoplanes hulinensis]
MSRLVARVTEVVALDRLRAAAATGSGAVVLITGEAGIGKTAVVEEFPIRASPVPLPVRLSPAAWPCPPWSRPASPPAAR